ncbi:MAG TPA: TOMM precursor leader peptide-binding protein [Bryobacteraceae bacterium]|nr:TOMM precursor leader peptide-binding protein [Bryobacteraceae bacterium]
MQRPRLVANYYVRLEPGPAGGEDALVFTSGRREIRLAGKSFTEFLARVVPLLDGRRTLGEIQEAVAATFSAADLARALALLEEQRLLEDAALDILDDETRARLGPQLHWLHEMGFQAQAVQQKLRESAVAVVGTSCLGAHAAASLEAAGLGMVQRVPAGHSDIRSALQGVHFVVAAVDAGLSSVLYQVNRACLDLRIPWTSAMLSAHEGLFGPTVFPGRTPCYLCYKMRAVACANDPGAAFAFEQFLDQRKHDDSARRENLPFFDGMLGHLLGLEALKVLSGLEPSAPGSLLVIDFLTMETSRHVVLRKPGCPACGH